MHDDVTRLVMVRHGETAWNRETRIQGHTDIPLSEHGRWQARQVAQALADEGLEAIYSSDLLRAADTAQAMADVCGVPLTLDPQLRERHFGIFEGLTHDEIMRQHPHEGRRWRERDPEYGPQGGETLAVFNDRVLAAAFRLANAHRGQSIALVAHGGVLDCFYRAATHVGLTTPRSWQVTNASVNRLILTDQGFSLVGWADTRHLEQGAQSPMDEVSDGKVSGSFNPAM